MTRFWTSDLHINHGNKPLVCGLGWLLSEVFRWLRTKGLFKDLYEWVVDG